MPVDAITPTFINAPDATSGPTYDAETQRRAFGGLVAGGPAAGVARSGVLDPRGMMASISGSNVQISGGPCAVGSGKGTYLSGIASVLTVAALGSAEWPAQDSTNPRRDRIVFEVLDPDNGGSTARKARVRIIAGRPDPQALTGGGYPADPGAVDGVSAFFNIADIDMPKAGNGSPSITDKRPFTAAAGAAVRVRSTDELAALPKWDGALAMRLDLPGRPLVTCDGTNWNDRVSGALSLANSYVAYGGGYEAPSYVKDPSRRVTLSGVVGISVPISMNSGGAQAPYLLATLPADAKIVPAAGKIFPVAVGPNMGNTGVIYINTAGEVRFLPSVTFASLAASNFYVSLDGIGWWV